MIGRRGSDAAERGDARDEVDEAVRAGRVGGAEEETGTHSVPGAARPTRPGDDEVVMKYRKSHLREYRE